ncbi:hypothetical protein DL98DRAFT_509341 [Cadophora sp. DSE1049]|nr:hypothetical protein DL98DRAFT_509341 [Cadophora sp. DSE1049]
MPFTRIPWRKASLAIGGAIGGLGLRVFARKSRDTDAMQPNLDIIECGKDAEFDIVFVHGLNPKGTASHARDTWTAELNGKKVFWPKELLPTSAPNVRVMLLAYNSNIAWNASIAGVREHATTVMNLLILKREESPNRPIIFICHSLGGLVMKQALLLEDPKFQEAINSTYVAHYPLVFSRLPTNSRGLVFFATPHRGATGNAAQIGFICADIVRTIQQEGKNTLPELLQKDSPLVDALARSFEEKLDQFHIISVYETRAMKPHGIVSNDDAGLPLLFTLSLLTAMSRLLAKRARY